MPNPRYDTIHGLLKLGHIKKFTDIFLYIPYTAVARDFGTNHNRMKKMMTDPVLWTLGELWYLADLIGYNRKKLAELAGEEGEAMRKATPGN
jgi:hypothetical protein